MIKNVWSVVHVSIPPAHVGAEKIHFFVVSLPTLAK